MWRNMIMVMIGIVVFVMVMGDDFDLLVLVSNKLVAEQKPD